MWPQNYTPLAGSLALTAIAAALPAFVMLFLLGVKRYPAWKASVAGLGAAVVVALFVYRMPVGLTVGSVAFGATFGLFPIGWIIFSAVLLYRVAVESGKFEIIKDSLGGLTSDRRLQALLIAFCFSAFLESAAGFGTPVAVASTMLIGLGFSPFYAASICLLANTVPVTFGSIGIPLITLSGVTNLPINELSAAVGLICFPASLIMPAYMILVMGGRKALAGVMPAALICGVLWGGVQLLIAYYVGPYLASMGSAVVTLVGLVILLLVWKPKDQFVLTGDHTVQTAPRRHSAKAVFLAWSPYVILVTMVILWGLFKAYLSKVSVVIPWPGLHQMVTELPPVVPVATAYPAIYRFDWLAAAGTAGVFSAIISAALMGFSPARFLKLLWATTKQVLYAEITTAAVLALAYVMNYSGATATLGLVFATTGAMFPFFSAVLGGLGGFLTGSNTSANALFGNLQVVTATRLGLNPMLMAAANSNGGMMAKMVSLQSIAVAAVAAGLPSSDEGGLFRFALKHSIILTVLVALITALLAYVVPQWVP
jgi:L-lactate transport